MLIVIALLPIFMLPESVYKVPKKKSHKKTNKQKDKRLNDKHFRTALKVYTHGDEWVSARAFLSFMCVDFFGGFFLLTCRMVQPTRFCSYGERLPRSTSQRERESERESRDERGARRTDPGVPRRTDTQESWRKDYRSGGLCHLTDCDF